MNVIKRKNQRDQQGFLPLAVTTSILTLRDLWGEMEVSLERLRLERQRVKEVFEGRSSLKSML